MCRRMFLVGGFVLSFCFVSFPSQSAAQVHPATASVTIRVKVPSNTPSGDTISLFGGTLFPVSPNQIPMSRVPGTTDTWQATLSRPAGTIIDYVFERNGDVGGKREAYVPVGSSNPQIYRKLLIANGAIVNEVVAQWIDLPRPADIATGTLTGRVTDQAGNPLAGIWVSAGPHQTLTNTDGNFTIYGVPAGPCTITVQSENGEYVATSVATAIAPNATVVQNLTLKDAAISTVTFQLTIPPGTPPGAVPRLYGDTYRLGMVQIPGGPDPDTTRMIDMAPAGGNQWSYSVQLGSGVCVNYLYTLGSYRLNYERDSQGNPVTRSLCVNGPTTVNEEVVAWKTPQQVPVSLTVTSPTGAQDALYVATDNYLGFAPVKMWSTGPGRATYTIYANPSTTLNYRYVRNGDPETGKEMVGTGSAAYRSLAVGTGGAASNDAIAAWQNQMREPALQTVTTGMTDPIVRTDPFQTGIQLIDYWRSSWLPLVQPTLGRVQRMNAQWVEIHPNWSFLSPAKDDFTTYVTTIADPPKVDPRYNEFPVQDCAPTFAPRRPRPARCVDSPGVSERLPRRPFHRLVQPVLPGNAVDAIAFRQDRPAGRRGVADPAEISVSTRTTTTTRSTRTLYKWQMETDHCGDSKRRIYRQIGVAGGRQHWQDDEGRIRLVRRPRLPRLLLVDPHRDFG